MSFRRIFGTLVFYNRTYENEALNYHLKLVLPTCFPQILTFFNCKKRAGITRPRTNEQISLLLNKPETGPRIHSKGFQVIDSRRKFPDIKLHYTIAFDHGLVELFDQYSI